MKNISVIDKYVKYYGKMNRILKDREVMLQSNVEIIILYGDLNSCVRKRGLWSHSPRDSLAGFMEIKMGQTVIIDISLYLKWESTSYPYNQPCYAKYRMK